MVNARKTKITIRKKGSGTKECSTCRQIKPLDDFYRHPGGKHGRSSKCKECKRKYQSQSKSKEAHREAQSRYRKRKPPKPVRVIEVPEGHKRCTKCGDVKTKDQFGNDRRTQDGLGTWCKECNSANVRRIQAKKYKSDPIYNLTQRFQSRVRASLPGHSLPELFGEILPYSVDELIRHLKTTVPDGFTWANVFDGSLQVDHKKPVCAFGYSSPDDESFADCWALNNLQLLPTDDHRAKGCKWNGKSYRYANKEVA